MGGRVSKQIPTPALLFGSGATHWGTELRSELAGADLRVAADAATAEPHWPEIEVLFTWNRGFGPDQFGAAPRLRWIHSLSAGIDGLLFPELMASQVLLTSTKGVHAKTMAHHALALILALARGLDIFGRYQTSARWMGHAEDLPLQDLDEKTLAVVGLGTVGREVASLARTFGMTILASRRHLELGSDPLVDRLFGANELLEMLSLADVVVLSCALTKETAGLFDAEAFAAMRPGAYLINLARGGVVQEDALVRALSEGQLAGVGLDVFSEEPLPASHPLWHLDRVIITPHVAVDSQGLRERAIALARENFRRFRAGEPLLNVVRKDWGY